MDAHRFSRAARIDILIGTGFAFSSSVSTIFVSMYLYRYLDGIASLTVFNLGQFILMPLGFYCAAFVARKAGNRSALGIGLGLFVAFYGLLVLLGERSSGHLVALGVLSGLANGFYWFPFNLITATVAEGADKGRFYGVSAALASAANAIGPLASTLAITLAPRPEAGYTYLFASIVAVMAVMTFAAFALPAEARSSEPVKVMRYLRLRGAEGRWRFALEASFLYGLRDGANWSVMSILILQGSGGETVAGYLAIGFAAFGIAANYLGGRTLKPRLYSAFWLWGSIAALVSAFAISLSPTLGGAIASGVLWKAAEALVLIPFNAAFLGSLARYIREEGGAAGRNVAAEVALNAGRAIGVVAFLVLSAFTPSYAQILFPALTFAVPATWLVYRRYARDLASG
jgi:MFS transporter, YQGE family, putative transporter